MIALMILGCFAAFAGAVLAARWRGNVGLAALGATTRFLAALFVAGIAGAVFGIVDLHAGDTRPGYEVVVAAVAPVLLLSLPGLLRRGRAVRPAGPAPPPPLQMPGMRARADDVAERLRQLDQLRESGLLDEAAYAERRRQILAEL